MTLTLSDINQAASIVCDDRQRLILHFAYQEQISFREIARRLELHPATVTYHHDRALAAIRRHIEGTHEPPPSPLPAA